MDPESETVEVLTEGDAGLTPVATYRRGQELSSPLLEGLAVQLEGIFD